MLNLRIPSGDDVRRRLGAREGNETSQTNTDPVQ